jgi:hypothetical protein
MLAHLMTATGLGIYYLMERLWQHDRAVITQKPSEEGAPASGGKDTPAAA